MRKRLWLLLLLTAGLGAQAQEGCTSKIQEYLSRSGYRITVASPCKVWTAPDALAIPRGEGLQGLLLIAHLEDMCVVGTVVRSKAKLDLSSELLVRLLQLNNQLDYVKTGIDGDGDLFVRMEVRVASLTEEDFKAVLKRVIEGSARVDAALKK